MNTSGLLQSISEARIHVNFAIMIPRTFQKLNILLIFTFCYKYLKYKNYFNLGIKTALYLNMIVLTV